MGRDASSDSLLNVQGTGCLCGFVYYIEGANHFLNEVDNPSLPSPLSSVLLSSHSKLEVVGLKSPALSGCDNTLVLRNAQAGHSNRQPRLPAAPSEQFWRRGREEVHH